MEKIRVKIKKVRENAVVPRYATAGAAACDLVACESVCVPKRGRALVPTGISISFENAAALIFARSGLAVRGGIALANGVGVIDADYRGEILVGLINNTDEDYEVCVGERVAQLAFVPIATAEFEETDVLDDTVRGAGGFGSTGGTHEKQ